jgi:hypothetical protein
MNTTFNQAFFANQASQNIKMQELIKQAQENLMCGPECQNIRNIEDLKQKYINAQTNVIAAPDLLQQAQKNYFTASQGVAGYNDVIEGELTNKANSIIANMQTEFDENIQKASSLTDTYQSLKEQTDYLKDLKKKYIVENSELNNEINNTFNDIVTNDRKTYYQEQNMNRVNGWYKLYWAIYIILLIIFLVFILLADSKYSLKFKAFIFVLFIFYPWVANYIVFQIIGLLQRIGSLLPKNIYKDL